MVTLVTLTMCVRWHYRQERAGRDPGPFQRRAWYIRSDAMKEYHRCQDKRSRGCETSAQGDFRRGEMKNEGEPKGRLQALAPPCIVSFPTFSPRVALSRGQLQGITRCT